jgi:predicted Rossmann-fold nucleotide-binding protein
MAGNLALAQELGTALGGSRLRLISDGRGLGRAVASAGAEAGASVTEVVSYAQLDKHDGVVKGTEVHLVRSVYEQVRLIYLAANAIIVLPGGLETLCALAEMIRMWDEDQSEKPIILLDSDDFFRPLVNFSCHLVADGLVSVGELDPLRYAHSVAEVCRLLQARYETVAAGNRPDDLVHARREGLR